MAATVSRAEQVRERLRYDTPLFTANFATIVKANGQRDLLRGKPEQIRFDQELEAQRAAGQPMRAIVLKARKLGFSTWTQAKLIQRVTQFPDRRALVLAQDRRTAGDLFNIGKTIYDNLPDDGVSGPADLKPKQTGRAKQRLMELANHSYYQSDSAREFESGRGLTLHDLHLSEAAFYPDLQRKLTGLLNAVPDDPATMVVIESTANGQNYFKELWDKAESGESGYLPFFSPWFEEPNYRVRFANDIEREDFVGGLGTGPYGEDEHELVEVYGLDPEQLAWRRRIIQTNFNGDLDRFKQEFPASPLEAFMATGKHVFPVHLIRKVQREVQEPVATGVLEPTTTFRRTSRGATVDVPAGARFVEGRVEDDRSPGWRVWEFPQDATDPAECKDCPGAGCPHCDGSGVRPGVPVGQYVIGVDASGGDERSEQTAYHVIQVINHRTGAQCAEYRSQIDPDLLAYEVYLACLFYKNPWAAIEITGSWGAPAVRRLRWDYQYPFTYQRPALDGMRQGTNDRLGWDTNWVTRAHLITGLGEQLRDGTHGIRSKGLADELGWFVKDKRNRQAPEPGKWSDRLMAFMIAKQVAREKPVRPVRKRGEVTSTVRNLRMNSTTGYRR
ncbi:MAG: hypothetical protein ACXWNS_08240 [Isosphaeraceae bacterium]